MNNTLGICCVIPARRRTASFYRRTQSRGKRSAPLCSSLGRASGAAGLGTPIIYSTERYCSLWVDPPLMVGSCHLNGSSSEVGSHLFSRLARYNCQFKNDLRILPVAAQLANTDSTLPADRFQAYNIPFPSLTG